jgi:cyclopropane fatty-acyl-phospholipid synthase-like methyltransferase
MRTAALVNDPHDQWERFGSEDPYFGVLTAPRYHRGRLDEAARERFFATGRTQIASLTDALEAQAGSALQSRHALDFGCGVGRLSLPLASHCQHVYGVDVSASMLREAERNAEQMDVNNVEWVQAARVDELSGRYDLLLSIIVFQHIPVREGEQIFAKLLQGLRPGGVGAVQFSLRPGHPSATVLRWARKSVPLAAQVVNVASGKRWSYPHMQLNSYSLNRLGRLLAEAGIGDWQARFRATKRWTNCDLVTLVFRKD